MSADILCMNCRAPVTPSDAVCPACHKALPRNDGTTIDPVADAEPVTLPRRLKVPRPDPDAVPKWMLRFRIITGVLAILMIVVMWRMNRIDRAAQLDSWTAELARELGRPDSLYREQPDDGQAHSGPVFFVGEPADFVRLTSMPRPSRFTTTKEHRFSSTREALKAIEKDRTAYLLRIEGGQWLALSATQYVGGVETFSYQRMRILVAGGVGWTIIILLALIIATDMLLVARHRRKELRAYEEYEREETVHAYAAQELLNQARELNAANEPAKALVTIDELLRQRPGFSDALELKRQIEIMIAENGSMTLRDFAPPPNDVSAVLYLRVLGTPYAYRAQSGATTVRVGRQRSNSAGSELLPNDLVIRVPASDDRTLRISRRHFEINRIEHDYFVVDHSGGRTRLNGRQLQTGAPAKIGSGDRLLIADVLTLEIAIRSSAGQTGPRIIQLGDQAARFHIEATVGDMLTEV
jgi:pSer/pThr/pTyr-binding forkhead associated (FHA) protein